MDNVYVIEWCWDSNCDCPDIWANLQENGIEMICDSEDSAAEYIVKYLQKNLDTFREKYSREKRESVDFPSFDKYLSYEGCPYNDENLPSKEDILEKIRNEEEILICDDYTTTCFICTEMPIYNGREVSFDET